MNIILIGPDGSGKTAVAKALGKILRYAVLHTQWEMFGRDKINKVYEFETEMLSRDRHIILDRHTAIESLIYREHFTYDIPEPDDEHLSVLEAPYNLLVYLTYDEDLIEQRKGNDEHYHMIRNVLIDFEWSLRRQWFKSDNGVIRYGNERKMVPGRFYIKINTSDKTAEVVAREIVGLIPDEHKTKASDRGFSKKVAT